MVSKSTEVAHFKKMKDLMTKLRIMSVFGRHYTLSENLKKKSDAPKIPKSKRILKLSKKLTIDTKNSTKQRILSPNTLNKKFLQSIVTPNNFK